MSVFVNGIKYFTILIKYVIKILNIKNFKYILVILNQCS